MKPRASSDDAGSKRQFFKRRGRILVSLLGVLALVSLSPLATGVWRVIDINREALATSTQEFQLLLASSIAEKVDFSIDGLRFEVVDLARSLDSLVRERGRVEPDEIRGVLASSLDERIRYVRYSEGVMRNARSISVGHLPDALESRLENGVAYAATRFTASPDRAHEQIVSQPITVEGTSSHSALVISVPVASGGNYQGMLSVLVDLHAMWESATAQNHGSNLVYALDATGRVFASTDVLQVVPGEDLSDSLMVQRFFSGQGRTRETMPFTEIRDGKERHFLGSYETTARGWGVFVRAEQREVYAPIRQVVASTVRWTLLVLGITSLGAVFFAASLSRPIKQLVLASRAFASGKFSTRVNVGTRNEIGELAHTFNTMASEIEEHIENLKLAAEEQGQLFDGTTLALAEVIDAKDPYTRGHSVRVKSYSVIIARRLGLSEEEKRDTHVASLLHDVGKIGVDDSILKKPGKLTPEEFEVMKTHAAMGANIMSTIPQMRNVLPGLRWHHERLDGSGYPDGLRGEQIPLLPRIIAVADTFDAVTSDRSYQATRTFSEGLQLLHDLKGALDPRVVDAFDRAYAEGEIHLAGQRQPSERTFEPVPVGDPWVRQADR
jgi:HD-GYP domain-containing protein (c-di-GMP phosphodiesterase class II)